MQPAHIGPKVSKPQSQAALNPKTQQQRQQQKLKATRNQQHTTSYIHQAQNLHPPQPETPNKGPKATIGPVVIQSSGVYYTRLYLKGDLVKEYSVLLSIQTFYMNYNTCLGSSALHERLPGIAS